MWTKNDGNFTYENIMRCHFFLLVALSLSSQYADFMCSIYYTIIYIKHEFVIFVEVVLLWHTVHPILMIQRRTNEREREEKLMLLQIILLYIIHVPCADVNVHEYSWGGL